jgi:hypothetical protein
MGFKIKLVYIKEIYIGYLIWTIAGDEEPRAYIRRLEALVFPTKQKQLKNATNQAINCKKEAYKTLTFKFFGVFCLYHHCKPENGRLCDNPCHVWAPFWDGEFFSFAKFVWSRFHPRLPETTAERRPRWVSIQFSWRCAFYSNEVSILTTCQFYAIAFWNHTRKIGLLYPVTRSYYRKGSAASPPRDQRQYACFPTRA